MQKRKGLYVVMVVLAAIVFLWFRQQHTASFELNRNPAQLIYTKHALCRMDCRKIDKTEVREILQQGTFNVQKSLQQATGNRQNNEPGSKSDPKYVLEGRTHDGQQVRIVFAVPSADKVIVVTVIDLGKEWSCDCK